MSRVLSKSMMSRIHMEKRQTMRMASVRMTRTVRKTAVSVGIWSISAPTRARYITRGQRTVQEEVMC